MMSTCALMVWVATEILATTRAVDPTVVRMDLEVQMPPHFQLCASGRRPDVFVIQDANGNVIFRLVDFRGGYDR